MADLAAARHFAEAASRYSRLREYGVLGRVRSREQAAVRELAEIAPGAAVLDAGCGDGATLVWLRSRGVDALGVDLTWPMARVCASRGLTAVVQDIEELGLRPIFNWVLCVGSLEFVSDPRRALENLAACLAPDGRLLLLYPRRGLLGAVYHLYHRTHGARIHLFGADEIVRLLTTVGLERPFRHQNCLMSSVCVTRLARGVSP